MSKLDEKFGQRRAQEKPIWWDVPHAWDDSDRNTRDLLQQVLSRARRGVVYVDRLSQDTMRVPVPSPYVCPPYPANRLTDRELELVRTIAIERARAEYIAQFEGFGGWTQAA